MGGIGAGRVSARSGQDSLFIGGSKSPPRYALQDARECVPIKLYVRCLSPLIERGMPPLGCPACGTIQAASGKGRGTVLQQLSGVEGLTLSSLEFQGFLNTGLLLAKWAFCKHVVASRAQDIQKRRSLKNANAFGDRGTWAVAVSRGSYKSLFLLNSGCFSLENKETSVLNFGSLKTSGAL